MVPHIVYRSEKTYFPSPKYWQIELSSSAPDIKTSGITQPPVQAIAAWYIYKLARNKNKVINFLMEIYPKILDFHRYLLNKRDPEDSGQVTIIHPWESGFDNSIRWDDSVASIDVKDIPGYRRTDLDNVGPEERPTDEFYDRYIYLIEILKKHNYEEEEIYKEIPFKVKDVVFTSILYMANKRLKEIASLIGENVDEINSWLERTKKNFFNYFCEIEEDDFLVYDFDLITGKKIKKRTTASLLGIYTDLFTKEQVEKIFAWMQHSHVCSLNCIHEHKLISSISFEEKEFNPLNNWRGPIWININWMLIKGLSQYGNKEEAENLRLAIIDLVSEHGFFEYYNPLTGDGLGIDEFS